MGRLGQVAEHIGLADGKGGDPVKDAPKSLGRTAGGIGRDAFKWTLVEHQGRRRWLAALAIGIIGTTVLFKSCETSDDSAAGATALIQLQAHGITNQKVAKEVTTSSYDGDSHVLTLDLVTNNDSTCQAKFEVAEDFTYVTYAKPYDNIVDAKSDELKTPKQVYNAIQTFLGSAACNPQSK